jgi:RNA polymerase primary sigma factor
MKRTTRRVGNQRPRDSFAPLLPRLSRDEEHDLAVRARAGDLAARQRLAVHAIGFVAALARRYRRGQLPLEDLIQEGHIGLLHALDKFDPEAGTRFATYAAWWIRAYLRRYVQGARSVVRPRIGDVAQADASLDASIDAEDGSTYVDRVVDDRPGPEAALMAAEVDEQVRTALERHRRRIGPLGLDIIQHRIQVDEPHSLEVVGRRWGLSRERIRQVELKTKLLLAALLDERAAA